MTQAPQPVLKWAGGKRRLVPDILAVLPLQVETYYEPFLGGGAVFFALAAQGRFRRAVLSDQNSDLVAVYLAVRDDVEGVIDVLRGMPHSEQDYYRIRGSRPRTLVRRAARIIYLNKTGYNGLYRVNRAGEYNVPFGRYARPNICDADNLRAVARALQGVEIAVSDFESTVRGAQAGDAVYFDPPYVPLSATSSFTAYHREPFGWEEHLRLARVFAELSERGVRVALSNSDTPETRQLYERFECSLVQVRRPINSNAQGRGPVNELLVSGGRGELSTARGASPLRSASVAPPKGRRGAAATGNLP
jgi:DNA adenine methylase